MTINSSPTYDIVYVDDSILRRGRLAAESERRGHSIRCFDNIEFAREYLINRKSIDSVSYDRTLIVVDCVVFEIDGVRALQKLRSAGINQTVVLLVDGERDTHHEFDMSQNAIVLGKPLSLDELEKQFLLADAAS